MSRILTSLFSSSSRSGTLPRLRAMGAVRRSRRALMNLSPEALEDVGLSQAEAQEEAHRPLWDVPQHWRG